MSYTITKTWLGHEGGTKFYQVILIQDNSGGPDAPAVTIGHFGPMSTAKTGKFSRPAAGGQTEIKVGNHARSKIRDKEKRGYSDEGSQQTGATVQTLETELTTLLGSAKAKDVLLKLGQTATPVRPIDKPKPAPQTERSAADTPAGWGDW